MTHPDHDPVAFYPEAIATGAIVAVAYVYQITPASESPWAALAASWKWGLDRVTFLPEPIPRRGSQGLWRLGSEDRGRVEHARDRHYRRTSTGCWVPA